MDTINGVQCREARMILRWNVKDLAYKSSVDVRKLRAFEALKEPLYFEEMKNVMKAFESENIIFTSESAYINHQINTHVPAAIQHTPQFQKAQEVLNRLLSSPKE